MKKLKKPQNMREKVKKIARKVLEGKITEEEAEQRLKLLFNSDLNKSDEINMPPLKRRRIHKILEADGNRCFYCGIETYLAPIGGGRNMINTSTVDHVLPKSKGGINHIDNCVNSCDWCNNQKGNEFLIPPSLLFLALKKSAK